jgi:pimeloyl-ACP methyl ester carboxylesterase
MTTFALIPGAGSDSWYWSRVAPLLTERDGRDPDAPLDLETTFLHDVAPDVAAALMARGEPGQADRPFEEPWPLEAWPNVPTTVLAGTRDRLFPLELVARLARERLGIEHVGTVDSGHLAALVRPEEVATWLLGS